MMKMMRRAILPALLVVLAGGGMEAQAQFRRDSQPQYGRQFEQVVNNLDSNFKRFQDRVDRELDRSRLDNTNQEDNINQQMRDFRSLTKDLRDTVNDNDRLQGQLRQVLNRGQRLQTFLDRHPRLRASVQSEWTAVRTNLNQLQNIADRTPRGSSSGSWRY